MTLVIILAIILGATSFGIALVFLIKCINSSNSELQRLRRELDHEQHRAVQISYDEVDALARIQALQQGAAVELARADNIARLSISHSKIICKSLSLNGRILSAGTADGTTTLDTGVVANPIQPSGIAGNRGVSSYGELTSELPRVTSAHQHVTISDAINRHTNEELVRLEQGVIVLHQVQDDNDQTVSRLAR